MDFSPRPKRQITCASHTDALKKSSTEDFKCDMIGPPHPVSNLRPIRFHIPENETPLEEQFRLKRQQVQQWNQDFWITHNTKFIQERKEFIAASRRQNSDTPLSADEMSVFYKAFLDKNWGTHLNYNMQWYKKNAQLALLNFRVILFQLQQSLLKRIS